ARLVEQFIKNPALTVELLLIKARGKHLSRIPDAVKVTRLRANSSLTATREVADYLKEKKPDVLLTAKDRAGRLALRARKLAGTDTPVFLQIHTTVSTSLKNRHPVIRWWRYRRIRQSYFMANKVFTVSNGVAKDLQNITGLEPDKFATVRNPLITDELFDLASQPIDHPWLSGNRTIPTILAAGRFTQQKDFATLVRAFAILQTLRPSRLIIIGDGPLMNEVKQLIGELGIEKLVSLPGFQDNPFSWMKNADLLVLSSKWEGLGNVIVESLAVGTPVVSTDCPSGPAEILQEGKLGLLVPTENPEALADAMASTLKSRTRAPEFLEELSEYTAENSAKKYLELMGLAD
ncbi:MAG TPA: glycosyltransferase, partial [Gammaproteobacteria bacterium]|nr:glycosyltransferase [Gammaproteobacteria bacterium]